MSNVHLEFIEDATGDLVDILYRCHVCGENEGIKDWPAPDALDYPVYCEDCSDRLPVPLTQDGERYMDETMPMYAWPGGYTVVYYDEQGDIWCPSCRRQAPADIKFHPPQTYDEGPTEYCIECNSTIESSYGDPDEQS